jgi:hypothetical protein
MAKAVRVRVTYECGKCANVQFRVYESKDGLLEIPNQYCGHCIGSRHFSLMSASISKGEAFETTDEATKAGGPERLPDVQPTGKAPKAAEPTSGGRVDSNAAQGKNTGAGTGSPAGVPGVVKAQGLPGQPVK